MKITIDGANIKDRKVGQDERGWLLETLLCDDEVVSHSVEWYSCSKTCEGKQNKLFDMDIYGASEVFEKYYSRLNLIYERFFRGVEIAETFILHPTVGI
jgi:hypothetical protein